MPFEIDSERLNDPSLQILDIGKPPVRQMAHQSYPKMVYLHPRDKTKQHRHQIVHNELELAAAEKQGWRTKPHVPVEAVEDLSEHFEAEPLRGPIDPMDLMSRDELIAEAKKRGITSIDGRSKTETILAALRAEPTAA